MRNLILSITGVALVLSLTGCASIMSGRFQELTFQSNPDGATVTVSGRVIGKTPLTTSLKKDANQSLVFEKDGYKPLSMQLSTRLDGWFWGNIVLGGLIGSTTDGLTGAVNEYSPSQYMVTLIPNGTTKLEEGSTRSSDQKTKDYIVLAYKDILIDLQKGDGQYLSSLLELLHVKPEGKSDAVKKIRALSEVYTVIPDFADHVIDLYRTPQANSIPSTEPPAVDAVAPQPAPECPFQLSVGQFVRVNLKSGESETGKLISCDTQIEIHSGISTSIYDVDKVATVDVLH